MPRNIRPKLYSVATCIIDKDGPSISVHTIEALSMRDVKREAERIVEPFVQDNDMVLIHCRQVTDKYIRTSKKLQARQESLAG